MLARPVSPIPPHGNALPGSRPGSAPTSGRRVGQPPSLLDPLPGRLAFILISLIALCLPPFARGNQSDERSSDTIDQLIRQLDSNQFRLREQATQALVESGNHGLRKLAYQYFGASPESAWRIKNILQRIGTENDNPETCFRAIAVLIVLDKNLGDGIVNLLNEWRETRSKKAIEYLVARGAKVKYELDAFGLPGPPRAPFARVMIDDVQIAESETGTESPAPENPEPAEAYDPSTAFQRVKEILAATPDENEAFVYHDPETCFRAIRSRG